MNVGIYHGKAGTRSAGGKAIFVQELARRLAANHRVFLYTERGPLTTKLLDSDVEVVQVPPIRKGPLDDGVASLGAYGRGPLVNLRAFTDAFRAGAVSHMNEHLDVLCTHHYLDDLLLSNAVSVPVVYQYHMLASPGLGAAIRERFTATDYHLANSKSIARAVRETYGRQVDDIITPGVDTEQFHPDAEPAFEHPDPVVLYVGRIVPEKGVFELVDAVARLDDARLYVVGRGEYETLEDRAAGRGIADRVRTFGPVDHHELHRYYTAGDVVCYPSHYETFGLVNVEAMACGVPVVTTDTPGIREYADHDETNLLVEPGNVDELTDALDRVLTSPAVRERLAWGGRERALDYDWDRQIDRLETFCERTVLA